MSSVVVACWTRCFPGARRLCGNVLHGPDVTAWRHALIDNLHFADGCRVLSLAGTMKTAKGARSGTYNGAACVGGRQLDCRIMLCRTPFFPWTSRGGVEHLSLTHEVRGCGIES